ncbi:MAG: hypothetical protein ACR2KC_08575, partial [Acidimicrobiales bacterium]
WQAWWSTWSPAVLGAPALSAPALGLLSLAGLVFLWAIGTLQHVLVLGPLVIGAVGAYKAARPWGSPRGRVAALVVYATVPVAINALAQGHWAGLVSYAAAPWVLAALGRLSGEPPHPASPLSRMRARVVALGLGVAVAAAFAPSMVFVVVAIGAGLLVGSLVAGRLRSGSRMLAVSVASAVVAAAMLMPWSFDVLLSRSTAFGVVPGPAAHLGWGAVLEMHTGPIGAGPLGWALLVAAALPLVIGRSWRLAWATRFWSVALVCMGITFAGSRGWVSTPQPEVLLAPAAAALAASVALGVVAFELDLPGYRFGWRQLASALAGVAALVAAIPVLTAVGNTRWHLPSSDTTSAVAFLPDNRAGDYRVLWVGAPTELPLASAYLADGVGYATSYDGVPDVTDTWGSRYRGASGLLGEDLRLTSRELTTKLGHLLAPMSIRYIIVPNRNAPVGAGSRRLPSPTTLLNGLQLQTDLQSVTTDPAYTVYLNAAWLPARFEIPRARPGDAASGDLASGDPRKLQGLSLAGATPVLPGSRGDSGSGKLVPGEVYVSATKSSRWSLDVGGTVVTPVPALGWAMGFSVPAAGAATLRAAPSPGWRALQVVEVLAWVGVIGAVLRDRRRRRKPDASGDEVVLAEWFEAMTPGAGRGQFRPNRQTRTGLGDIDSDEVWDRV